jgi:hypothetical protein
MSCKEIPLSKKRLSAQSRVRNRTTRDKKTYMEIIRRKESANSEVMEFSEEPRCQAELSSRQGDVVPVSTNNFRAQYGTISIVRFQLGHAIVLSRREYQHSSSRACSPTGKLMTRAPEVKSKSFFTFSSEAKYCTDRHRAVNGYCCFMITNYKNKQLGFTPSAVFEVWCHT